MLTMKPNRKATDKQLSILLAEALEDLAICNCTFFACEGPKKVVPMATCRKCYAERLVARVKASLDYRLLGNANH